MMAPSRVLIGLLVFLASCHAIAVGVRAFEAAQRPDRALIVENGLLIDGTGAAPRRVAAVIVRDGRFAQIIPHGQRFEAPADATRVDARGRTLVPGVWDLHLHLTSLADIMQTTRDRDAAIRTRLAAMLASGVTGVLSTSDPTEYAVELRRRIRDGEVIGPRYFTCGNLLTPRGGHPGPYTTLLTGKPRPTGSPRSPFPTAETPEEVRRAVQALADAKVDAIKLVIESGPPFSFEEDTRRMSLEVATAAVDTARAAGLPTFAHVTGAREAADAVDAGVRAFVHSVIDDPIDDQLLARIRARQVGYINTLSIFEGFVDFTGPDAPWDDPLLTRFVEPAVIAASRDRGFLERMKPVVEWARAGLPHGRANLRRVIEAGVTAAFGTDVGNPFVFHGYATHREIKALAAAGLDPVRIVRTASLEGARILGLHDRYGSVEVGKAADLLILGADPTRDVVEAFRRVETVIMDGRLVDLAALPLPSRSH